MDALADWTDFNVAIVGAAAALAGLVIVAASVNISDIIKAPSLTARLAAGIAGLILAVAVAAVGLIPHLHGVAYGIFASGFALVAAGFQVQAAQRIYQNHHPENRLRPLKVLVGFAAPLCYLVGGVCLIAGASVGLLWFAAGSIVAIVAALLISWIVLVEVLR